jgi:hypothetical protein
LEASSRLIQRRHTATNSAPKIKLGHHHIFGNLASAGISNLYYPESNRNGARVTIDNALINTAEGAISALLQEFILKKLSRGVQSQPADSPPGAPHP